MSEAARHTATAACPPETDETLAREFGARIREAMDISLSKKYVKTTIEGLLQIYPPVILAKRLVKPGSDIKSGLKSLAKHGALHLSFESIMLETCFAPLFNKNDLDCARFNLFEADPSYRPPSA
ncbi:hypothetical protein D3C72_2081740 [compost metagenome]